MLFSVEPSGLPFTHTRNATGFWSMDEPSDAICSVAPNELDS